MRPSDDTETLGRRKAMPPDCEAIADSVAVAAAPHAEAVMRTHPERHGDAKIP
jgi:hypothetical protein